MSFPTRFSFAILATFISAPSIAMTITATSHVNAPDPDYPVYGTDVDSTSSRDRMVMTEVGNDGGEYGPHAFAAGNGDGTFGINTSGHGSNFRSSSEFLFRDVFHNTAAGAQHFYLDLVMEPGNLVLDIGGNQRWSGYDPFEATPVRVVGPDDAALPGDPVLYPVYSSASMLAQILVDGVVKWEAGATLKYTSLGMQVEYSGGFESLATASLYTPQYAEVVWHEAPIRVDLGVIDGLSAFNFEYSAIVEIDDRWTHLNYAFANYGDPFSPSGQPINQDALMSAAGPVDVPEPASLALLTLGAMGLLLTSRNRATRA